MLAPNTQPLVRVSLQGIPKNLGHIPIMGSFDANGYLRRVVITAYNIDIARTDFETAHGYHERICRLIIQAADEQAADEQD